MRTFFQLLPYRLEKLLSWRGLRVTRAARSRLMSAPAKSANSMTYADGRRLFVDLTIISKHDAGTGIQRVVRALALALLDLNEADRNDDVRSSGWNVHFVSASRRRPYHCISWPGSSASCEPAEMRARPGDVFLGLDYSLDMVRRHRHQLAQFRRDGGALWFLVHDLLPVNQPQWFSTNTVIRYHAWLGILAGHADGFFCNSPQTEADLRLALDRLHGLRDGYRAQVVPMGHAIRGEKQFATSGVNSSSNVRPRFNTAIPFALMVGTLEPRKGHADVLAAFDVLWRRGRDFRLVLVGRMGWQVEKLSDLILKHREFGKRLLWLDDVEDVELSQLYAACAGMIIASHGEGFGLPLIEALGYERPVLARDLPVFRLHEGKGVRYFPAVISPEELANLTEQWLLDARNGQITVERPTGDWHDSARILLEALEPA